MDHLYENALILQFFPEINFLISRTLRLVKQFSSQVSIHSQESIQLLPYFSETIWLCLNF